MIADRRSLGAIGRLNRDDPRTGTDLLLNLIRLHQSFTGSQLDLAGDSLLVLFHDALDQTKIYSFNFIRLEEKEQARSLMEFTESR